MENRFQKGLVSVIVPAFNRVRFIQRTIESVLEQTYSDVQLIVGDDGSTDGTYEILKEYEAEERLELVTHSGRANRGQSATLNKALDRARGEFICILDSDDMFAPAKLERQVTFLDQNPDIGLVYSNGYAVDENDRILHEVMAKNHAERNRPDDLLLDCYFLLPQNSMVKKAAFDTAGRFEESFRSAQDHDMLLRIVETNRIAYLPEYLFFYRRHSDSISGHSQHLRWHTGFEILHRAAKRYPYRRTTIRRRRAVLHFRMGEVYWYEGHLSKSIGHLILAGLLDPIRAGRVVIGRDATTASER